MSSRTIWRGLFLCWIFTCLFYSFAQTVVEDHWSPYDYPKEIPADVQYHIVVDGDTLWDISARYLGDPLLWPQIFQANSYIGDPDLIYPGDPIFLNVGVVVTDRSIAEDLAAQGEDDITSREEGSFGVEPDEFTRMDDFAEASEEEGTEEGGEVSEITSFDSDATEFVILPAGDRSDMECSTYLYPIASSGDVLPFDFRIYGGENRLLVTFSEGEIVYLNKGLEDGIMAGEVYSARRNLKKVYNPNNGNKFMGFAIDQIGKIKIVAVQDKNATGLITENCQELRVGDFLVPYEQEPIPLITELPVVNRFEPFSKEGTGSIVLAEDGILAIGKGHLANITLGIENNVAPGDLFIIYRPNPANTKSVTLPDIYLGHGVALKTSAQSTVMKIIESHTDINIGDLVVPLTQNSFIP